MIVMFSNSYHGSQYVEVLTGKDSTTKLISSSITSTRSYERSIKSYAYNIDTKLQLSCPANASRDALGLLQPILCMQINLCSSPALSIDLVVRDGNKKKRRILISTSYQRMESNELHLKVPLTIDSKDTTSWLNILIDVAQLTHSNFSSIDSFTLRTQATYKLRKVFTLPVDTVPSAVNFPEGVEWNLISVTGSEPDPSPHDILKVEGNGLGGVSAARRRSHSTGKPITISQKQKGGKIVRGDTDVPPPPAQQVSQTEIHQNPPHSLLVESKLESHRGEEQELAMRVGTVPSDTSDSTSAASSMALMTALIDRQRRSLLRLQQEEEEYVLEFGYSFP